MECHELKPEPVLGSGPENARRDLALRLDDLRGFGLLPTGGDWRPEGGEPALLELALALTDALESTQRRVIETSIQILSLRELVAKLLSLRTSEEVAETVALYLQKAFDHERVLVGIHDPGASTLEGWTAVRNGDSACRRFHLEKDWKGGLRDVLGGGMTIRGDSKGQPFLEAEILPRDLRPFTGSELGAYVAHPLIGRHGGGKVLGVLVVGNGPSGGDAQELEVGTLDSVVAAVGTALENVLLQADVRREQAFRKDIMRSMASGLLAVDVSGRLLAMNAAAVKLTGFRPEILKGKPLQGFDPAGGGIALLLEKTLRARRPVLGVERVVLRADGSAFPASCTTSVLRNPNGEVYGAVVTFDDLTEHKSMEARIRALDRLAALGRFTAGIAHEIRNPLTGIGTGVQYLSRHLEGDVAQKQNLDFIESEIARLDRIVEDLFRVTHPYPLRKIPEGPQKLLERALRSLGELPEEAGVTVSFHLAPDLPAVPVDPDQIQQVFLNLLKNAVEATPRGGTVEIHGHSSSDETRPHLVLQIQDSGPGIDADSFTHLFEPFFTKGKPKGTGLGLYVSHGIVERHGGELLASNGSAGGAIFTLKLPLDNTDIVEALR